MHDLLLLNGSLGEGGGQILRSALSLSLVTGRPFRIERIRAGRKKPGLLRQHLTAVEAARQAGRAEVSGATLGSQDLTFRPSAVGPGDYTFEIGSAGSATLVVQTILPALLAADGPSRLTVGGGTHNPAAPTFEFLDGAFLPLIGRLGPVVQATLHRHGFYPTGGGRLSIAVRPAPVLRKLALTDSGPLRSIEIEGVVARLPRHIAAREIECASTELAEVSATKGIDVVKKIRELEPEVGPGNILSITVRREAVTEVFTGFGIRGVPAEQVGREAAMACRRYVEAGVAVGEHLADQLLLPLALSGGGRFTATALSPHARTNSAVILQFLSIPISSRPFGEHGVLVQVGEEG